MTPQEMNGLARNFPRNESDKVLGGHIVSWVLRIGEREHRNGQVESRIVFLSSRFVSKKLNCLRLFVCLGTREYLVTYYC